MFFVLTMLVILLLVIGILIGCYAHELNQIVQAQEEQIKRYERIIYESEEI